MGFDVPDTVWRLERSALLGLMADAVWPDRYARRRAWVEQHVATDGVAFVRILLRNRRSWPARYEGEPDFCWRLMVRVSPAHREPCTFLMDVFDRTLATWATDPVRGGGPDFDLDAILGAEDFD